MRLDHLLSKEHHPSKDGMEPAARGCRVGVLIGGDTGEHLVPATADSFLVLPPFWGCGTVWGLVRLVGVVWTPC